MGARDEPPVRTCPSCGVQARTRFERCPACGRSYFATPRATQRRRARLAALAGTGVVVALGIGAAVLLADADERRERERTDAAAREAALRARLTRIQAPHRGSAAWLRVAADAPRGERLAARAALVEAVEDAITRDARARVRGGELDGPVAETECGPLLKSSTAVPDDRRLERAIGRYDCVAVKRPVVDGAGRRVAALGHPFVAALDFERFTYVWCRNSPAQGERGVALVFVRLERACLAAKGRALGTGYVDVPGS